MPTLPRVPTADRGSSPVRPAPRRRERSGPTRPRSGHGSPLLAVGVWRRRLLARLPAGTGLVVAAALLVASWNLDPLGGAGDPSRTSSVVVATGELPAGVVVQPGDVEVRVLPSAAVAAGAATEAQAVVGRQVAQPIHEGEPVLDARLAPVGLLGVAGATPSGWSAFALTAGPELPPTEVGQVVSLFAPAATASLTAGAGGAEQVATGARVVAVDEDRVTVAVRPGDAPGVAAALAGSTVVLAIAGPAAAPEPGG